MAQKETSFNTDIHRQFWVKTPHGDRNLLYARLILRTEIIQEAHGSLMSGHNAIECTINHIKTLWWWASMKTNVRWHIRRCFGCQKMQKSDNKPDPLPIPRGRKVRLYTNLCMTITFTKIAVVVPIPDKVATIAATNILHHWIYRFSAPEQIHTDGGKEFVIKLSDECWALMGI